jgi:hypothetical protein
MDAQKKKTMLRNSHRARSLIAVLAATALVVGLAACGGGETSSSVSSTGGHATPGEAQRTIVVFNHEPAAPSPSPLNLHAGLEEGTLPDGTVTGTVLTDEDCAPDQQGISHCRNEVHLDSGQTVVLRHPHDMQLVPCLAPGEEVLLRRA